MVEWRTVIDEGLLIMLACFCFTLIGHFSREDEDGRWSAL